MSGAGEGNNSDGIIATSDGGILIAQNDNSQVLKLDKDGKMTVVYMGLNTSAVGRDELQGRAVCGQPRAESVD